ncbi:MAG: signal peptidase I [Acidimicrobiales bacterium]
MTAATHVVTVGTQIRARSLLETHLPHMRQAAIWLALGLAFLLPVAMILLVTGDYRPMVVSSETMAPALQPGDVIVNEVVAPADVRVGDIVSYSDNMRAGAVVTERVIDVQAGAGTFSFVTAADTGTPAEHWEIEKTGRVGRVAFHAPGVGRWAETATSGFVGVALLTGLVALLVGAVVRPLRAEL